MSTLDIKICPDAAILSEHRSNLMETYAQALSKSDLEALERMFANDEIITIDDDTRTQLTYATQQSQAFMAAELKLAATMSKSDVAYLDALIDADNAKHANDEVQTEHF